MRKLYNTIEHNGQLHEIRTFLVRFKGVKEATEITIAKQSLSDELEFVENPEDEAIDEGIYFYVTDEDFNESAKVICLKYLDEPIKFIEEII